MGLFGMGLLSVFFKPIGILVILNMLIRAVENSTGNFSP